MRARLLGILIAHLASVIIRHLNVVRITAVEPKADPPLIVDGNRILTSPLSLEPMKPVARGNFQVRHARREIQICQLSQRSLPDSRRKPLRSTFLEQLPRMLVSKGFDHERSVMWCVTPVNGKSQGPERKAPYFTQRLGPLRRYHTVVKKKARGICLLLFLYVVAHLGAFERTGIFTA